MVAAFKPVTAKPVAFAAGQVSATVTITITGDATVEGAERFGLVVVNPVGTTIADGSGDVTISDDD